MTVVLDASWAVKWYAAEPDRPTARRLLETDEALLAPDLLPLEVASALTRKARRREFNAADVAPAMTDLGKLPIVLAPHAALLTDATALSLTARHPVADCLYLVLARDTPARLATFDTRLAAVALTLAIPLWTPPP